MHTRSLRRLLLGWLLIPLLVLLALGSVGTFYMARNAANDAYDKELLDPMLALAQRLSELSQLGGTPRVFFTNSGTEAVEAALCYGWIDGQADTFDAEHWLQRFTPRRARSKWSKINCARATELINTGRMKPAGLREVERAKADGRWAAAYDAQSAATIPEDLGRALKKSGKARASFKALDSRNRYAILYRIQDAKKPETRARRIATFVQMLEDGSTLYP